MVFLIWFWIKSLYDSIWCFTNWCKCLFSNSKKYFPAMQNVFDKIHFQLWHICFSKLKIYICISCKTVIFCSQILIRDANTFFQLCKMFVFRIAPWYFASVQTVCLQCNFACLQQDMHLKCKTFFHVFNVIKRLCKAQPCAFQHSKM